MWKLNEVAFSVIASNYGLIQRDGNYRFKFTNSSLLITLMTLKHQSTKRGHYHLRKWLTYTSASLTQELVVTLLGLAGMRTFNQSIDGRLMNLLPLVE